VNGDTPEASVTARANPLIGDDIEGGPPAALVVGMLILVGGTLLVLLAFAFMKGNSASR
jgi:hypothetical protein